MTLEDWMRNFGENLQDILHEKGLTQRMLSSMTGIPASTISTYINGSVGPSAAAVVKIVYAIDADYFDLLDFGDTIE